MIDLSEIRERWRTGENRVVAHAHAPSDIAALFERIEELEGERDALRVRLGIAEELLRQSPGRSGTTWDKNVRAFLSDGAP